MVFSNKIKKKLLLWLIIILNIFSLACSLYTNNYLHNSNKLADSALNFFWEWLTVFWCVWSSVFICLYSFWELKDSYKPKFRRSKIRSFFGLFIAIASLFSILIFLATLPNLVAINPFFDESIQQFDIFCHFLHFFSVYPNKKKGNL